MDQTEKISLKKLLNKFLDDCPDKIDLTQEKHGQLVAHIADQLILNNYSIEDINIVESDLLNDYNQAEIFILLGLKLARSKLMTQSISRPFSVSIIFAVYKEHNRILASTQHPHGEDFLRRKVKQLRWLFEHNPDVHWELVIVDDGCPEGSGRIAQEMIKQEGLEDKVRVIFLSDSIKKGVPPATGLRSTSDSQKGGSIVYGMWDAYRTSTENHIIIFTDADLSTHLGQVMLLVDPILMKNKSVAIGSRRETRSVVIKQGSRNNRGKLFIYLWKRLIPNLGNIIDTQCGFKAFSAQIIPDIIEDMVEKKFAFDIELLLRSQQRREDSIVKIPIAWVDSEAASTTTDLQPYLPMLKSIAAMSKKYFPEHADGNPYIDLIESIDEEAFGRMLNNIPVEITSREPSAFGDWKGVSADLLRKSIGE